MRTFRRDLLSYLCTLLLPVLVLSVVIYEVVVSYCGAQLIEQNLAALQQLSLSVSMQREQLDAYAVQTTNRSEFFYRNQKQPGDFYEIQSILSRWMASNAFIDDICYYNSKLDRIYAFDAVYSIDSFARWRTQSLLPEEIRQIVSSSDFNRWTAVSGEDGDDLFYFASARVSPQERNWLICKVNRSTLDAMVEGTRLYVCAVLLHGSCRSRRPLVHHARRNPRRRLGLSVYAGGLPARDGGDRRAGQARAHALP